MDTYSQMSMDSEDSIPRNVYEEVIVDSTIHPFDPKEDVVGDYAEDTMMKSMEPLTDTEDDSEVDIESNSSASTAPGDIESSKEANNMATGSQSLERPHANQAENQKSSNLKLVLKKPPEYQLVKNVTSPNSPNKIILVTLVSSANTSPVYSTAKYSNANNSGDEDTPKITQQQLENLPCRISEDSNSGEVLKVAGTTKNDGKSLRTYNRPLQISTTGEATKVDSEKDTESIGKDETDVESIKSESDSKHSTPKIRRELKELQKTVNESKILSEYMSDNSMKNRKTRKFAQIKDQSDENDGLTSIVSMRSRSQSCSKRTDSPVDNEKLDRWPSEEKINKRQNMRSQNSEFVQKQMKFLNSIQSDDVTDNSDGETSITDGKSSSQSYADNSQLAKRELHPPPMAGWDMFCFKCHSGCDLIPCSKCIRSYHGKCVKNPSPSKMVTNWICPECVAVENSLRVLSNKPRSNFTADNLSQLLQFALKRMKQTKGSDIFLKDLNDDEYLEYSKYIVNPISLDKLQNHIEKKFYRCAEEFAIDVKWILHNCMVYFENKSKLTTIAKNLVKVCRQEVTEIDTCSECYYNANTRKDWFVEVCSRPHILVWAKLKGFPHWPAKAMGANAALVNVRFFGAHDRAHVPIKECFLYSEQDPNPPSKQNKRNTIAECVKEVEVYIRNLTAKFGSFIYPPFRTAYDPNKEMQQMEMMIPGITDILNNAEKASKPALTYKIVKSADNHLSIIKKSDATEENISSPNSSCDASAVENTTRKHQVKSTDSPSNNNVSSLDENCPMKETNTETKTLPVKVAISKKSGSEKSDSESSKTYEVVSKVSDQEQTKVTSVILKRKSDNWNAVTQVANKKSKSEAIEGEKPTEEPENKAETVTNIATTTAATNVIPSKPIITSAKRKRSHEENTSKLQKTKLDEDKMPPLVLLTQPYVKPQTTSSSAVASTSGSSGTATNSNTNACSRLHSSVTVTITHSPAIVTTPSETTSSSQLLSSICSVRQLENLEISIKPIPKKSSQAQSAAVTSSSEKTDNAVTVSKESNETSPAARTNEAETSKSRAEPKRLSGLIPFEEIKTEKPDADEVTIEVRSKTATPEQPNLSTKPNLNCNDISGVVIKQEITSDDEASSNASKSEENGEIEIPSNSSQNVQATNTGDNGKLLPSNNSTAGDKKKPGTLQPESTKQRARKSFPNKSTFNPVSLTVVSTSTAGVKRNPMPQPFMAQNNSMVYIPVDPKASTGTNQNTPAIQTLTSATSKTSLSSTLPAQTVNSTVSSPSSLPLSTIATPLSTILTTATVQLPIIYSELPLSVNGPSSSQVNNPTVQVGSLVQTNATPSDHMLSSFVTPALASAITDTIVKGPPQLAPRPTGPFRSDGDYTFPTEAGPVSKLLMDNAHKMTDFFRSVIEDSLSDMANDQNLEAKVRLLELELEKIKYTHEKEIAELKHNTDMMLCEMRKSMDNEKTRLIGETRKQCELERIRAVEEAKTKQWCAACGKEAQFYCCWNTSYCDYPCQQKHWSRHMNTCAQKDNTDVNAQRIGVKVSSYNAVATTKDRQCKTKETLSVSKPIQNTFIRAQSSSASVPPRNSFAGLKRLIPITPQTTPRYTIINNNEGNWGLVKSPPFPRIFPTTGLIMSDSGNKTLPGTIIRTTKL